MKTIYFTLTIITGLVAVIYFSQEAGQYQPFIETLLITLGAVWFAIGCIALYEKLKTKY